MPKLFGLASGALGLAVLHGGLYTSLQHSRLSVATTAAAPANDDDHHRRLRDAFATMAEPEPEAKSVPLEDGGDAGVLPTEHDRDPDQDDDASVARNGGETTRPPREAPPKTGSETAPPPPPPPRPQSLETRTTTTASSSSGSRVYFSPGTVPDCFRQLVVALRHEEKRSARRTSAGPIRGPRRQQQQQQQHDVVEEAERAAETRNSKECRGSYQCYANGTSLPLPLLQLKKVELKGKLKQFDADFAAKHEGRHPTKVEKKPIRNLYVDYAHLKRRIKYVERVQRDEEDEGGGEDDLAPDGDSDYGSRYDGTRTPNADGACHGLLLRDDLVLTSAYCARSVVAIEIPSGVPAYDGGSGSGSGSGNGTTTGTGTGTGTMISRTGAPLGALLVHALDPPQSAVGGRGSPSALGTDSSLLVKATGGGRSGGSDLALVQVDLPAHHRNSGMPRRRMFLGVRRDGDGDGDEDGDEDGDDGDGDDGRQGAGARDSDLLCTPDGRPVAFALSVAPLALAGADNDDVHVGDGGRRGGDDVSSSSSSSIPVAPLRTALTDVLWADADLTTAVQLSNAPPDYEGRSIWYVRPQPLSVLSAQLSESKTRWEGPEGKDHFDVYRPDNLGPYLEAEDPRGHRYHICLDLYHALWSHPPPAKAYHRQATFTGVPFFEWLDYGDGRWKVNPTDLERLDKDLAGGWSGSKWGPRCVREKLDRKRISYLSEGEAGRYVVDVRNFNGGYVRLTYRESGLPVFPNDGDELIYVWALDGTLYVLSDDHGVGHSTPISAGPCRAAGQLEVKSNGRLIYVNFASGHYKPTVDGFLAFYNWMVGRGLRASSVRWDWSRWMRHGEISKARAWNATLLVKANRLLTRDVLLGSNVTAASTAEP